MVTTYSRTKITTDGLVKAIRFLSDRAPVASFAAPAPKNDHTLQPK